MDDGSTDNSRDKLLPFAGAANVCLESHQGNIQTAHAGLAMAQGEYFVFLDADDACEPTFVGKLAGALDANPAAAFAYCDYLEVGSRGTRRVAIDNKLFQAKFTAEKGSSTLMSFCRQFNPITVDASLKSEGTDLRDE